MLAASENEEVFGESRELHDGFVGDVRAVFIRIAGMFRVTTSTRENLFPLSSRLSPTLKLMRPTNGVTAIETKENRARCRRFLSAGRCESGGDDFGLA